MDFLMRIFACIDSFFYYRILGIPFILLLLVTIASILTIKMKFANFRLICEAIKTLTFRNNASQNASVQISPFTAFVSQAAGNLGLGNIAGASLALYWGGPGVVFWMIVCTFLFSIIKFTEITLGHKHRFIDKNGTVSGGPFYYIKYFFDKHEYFKIGKIISNTVAILMFLVPTIWSAFQINQIVSIAVDATASNAKMQTIFLTIIIMLSIGVILLGGIKRIGAMANMIVPFMALAYFLMCAVIIYHYSNNIKFVMQLILQEAFSINGAFGGMASVVVVSMQRIILATEAGIGTAAVMHASANVDTSVRQGLIGIVDCIIITVCITLGCLSILVSNINYLDGGVMGIKLMDNMFSDFFAPLHVCLMIIAFLFGFTSVISNGYYVQKAFNFVFNGKMFKTCIVLYIVLTIFISFNHVGEIINMSDTLIMLILIPNTFAVYALSSSVKDDLLYHFFTKKKDS